MSQVIIHTARHRTVLAGLLLLALPALDVPCSLGEPTELLQSDGWW